VLLTRITMKRSLLILLIFRTLSAAFAQDTVRVGMVENTKHPVKPRAQEMQVPVGRAALSTLTIINDLPGDAYLDLNIALADSIVAVITRKSGDTTIITGAYTNTSRWPFPENPGIVPVFIPAADTLGIHVRIWSDEGRPFSSTKIVVQSRKQTLLESVEGFRNFIGRAEFNGFFLGATVFAMLFFLLIWAKVGQPVFLFYSSYLLGAALYSLVVKTLPYSHLAKIAYLNYPLSYKLGEPIQYLFFAAYIAFARALLDIDDRYRSLNKTIGLFTYILIVAGLGLLLYNLIDFDYRLQQQAFLVSRLIILPVGLILLFWIIFQVKSPVKWFFVTGSSFFFLGGLLAVIVDPKSRHLFFGITDLNPIHFFKTGILLECLCFALALGYKIRMQQKERNQALKDYIAQLELNRYMVESENQRLEKMVSERTQEILYQNRLIEEQKQQQIHADLQRQLTEMEMKALRSQMNPHFIFNSLNSIRYQILKQDYDQAVTYLNQFSKLLRYVLQNSREHVVSLEDEIEMNRLYVELEKLRFSQGFKFTLQIQEQLDISGIMVPPMLLQPYIENAVKHGLVPSRKAVKELQLIISRCENGYQFIIEDNGVGRNGVPRAILHGKQQLGMVIARERIELFNIHFTPDIKVQIEDLFEAGSPSGTRILVTYSIS
jgi:signal transduction histidine kinase